MTQLMWVDYALLGLIVLSALVSLLRGFLREAMALVGWAAAVWMALTFTEEVAVIFQNHIEVPSVRLAAAAALLFLGTLLVSGLVVFLLGQLVDKTGLSGTDRVLGVVFGAGRGVVIAALLVMLAGLTPLPQDPWWRQSLLLPYFERVAVSMREMLPDALGEHLRFSLPEAPGAPVVPAPPAAVSPG
jgi:membrane protein required for colicin V production